MRKTIALLALAGAVAVGLAGCSNVTASTACPTTPAGPDAGLVKVSGDFGKAPDVLLPTPLAVQTGSVATVSEGSGTIVQPNATLRVDYTAYDAATGEVVGQTGYDGAADQMLTSLMPEAGMAPTMIAGLCGQRSGARVVIAETADEAQYTDPVVYVLDIGEVFPGQSTGFAMQLPQGFPAVVTNDEGVVGVTVPATTAPPTTLQTANRINGQGDVVKDGDTIVVQYTRVLWSTGKVLDSTWQTGQPAIFSFDQGGNIIPGLEKALVGQKVGSQVVAIIPPSDGYGEQGSPDGIVPGNATLVEVVDILGIVGHAS